MKGYVEKIIKDYPDMVERRQAVKNLLESLKNTQVSVDDIIEMLTFSHPEGERVQTSGVSDKVSKIALSYRNHQERMNAEMIRYWIGRYDRLNTEIVFLESSIRALPEDLSNVMELLVIKNKTWEETSQILHMSTTTVHRMRKQAVDSLLRIYQKREAEESKLLLS